MVSTDTGDLRRFDHPRQLMALVGLVPTETSQPTTSSLSAQLRTRTQPLHDQAEFLLKLPSAIRSGDDYVAWLGRFLGLYEPLEHSLESFPEWHVLGLARPSCSHAACLADDLTALGANPDGLPRASPAALPQLSTVAHALGARYVLEGATLGGRLILRDVEDRIGVQIAGATRFFSNRGEAVGPTWRSFRAALDSFGEKQPQFGADVISGAERTFRAMLAWFEPFCAARVGRP